MAKSGRNNTWELNHAIIRDSYVKLIKKLKRKPTYPEVAEDSKLSETTIKKHIDTLKFEPHKHPLRVLTEDVLLNIANCSRKNAASQKLWMQLFEGFSERQIMEHTGEISVNSAREKLLDKLTEKENGAKRTGKGKVS